MDRTEIAKQTAKILLDTKSILINTKDPFTYTSGKIGPTYADIRRMISFPKERKILMDYAAEIIRPLGIDYVAGGETAGIPYAAFIAERLGIPMIYVRKKPKGHGRMAQIEGHIEGNNKKVILIEDLLTVGSSQQVFVKALREVGLQIDNSFVIFSYDIYSQSKENLADMKINLHSLTNWWAILDCVKSENHFDKDTIESFENFLNAPNEWEQNFQKKLREMSFITPKLTFLATETDEAQKALEKLRNLYGDVGVQNADIAIVLGGDGTMLEALHSLQGSNLSVYGMNCGSLGFLLNPFRPEELIVRLKEAHEVDIFPLLMTAVDQKGKKYEAMAFNEVSLLRETRQAAKLTISVDNIERIPELVCDGILLATPAGSTAYNLSAHGPIIPLSANVLALTPISAFRPRRWRGALLPSSSHVKIDIINAKKRPVSATADSTEIRDVKTVEIRQSKSKGCTLLFDPDHNLEERIVKEQFIS